MCNNFLKGLNIDRNLTHLKRTSNSLKERLSIKMDREKFQRKHNFFMKMIKGSTLKLPAKVIFS